MYTRQDREKQMEQIVAKAGKADERLQSPIAVIYQNGSHDGKCVDIVPQGAEIWNCTGEIDDNDRGVYYALGSDRRVDICIENGSVTIREIRQQRHSNNILTVLNPKYRYAVGIGEINILLREKGIDIENLLSL